ncbi:srs domain-containing protein [Cystoisospora suis]|uniref:Srs domain-containing protein n=1 Tax=Cystoisospora suis TaxID=483139 RepID=A0A2C6K0P4_9APIC|nr:srs domain-containing protein [Cystoisospora suis]
MTSPRSLSKSRSFSVFIRLRALFFLLALTAHSVGSASGQSSASSNVTGQVATCIVPSSDPQAQPPPLEGSVSQANPTIELVCQGDTVTAVPDNLAKVCKPSTTAPAARASDSLSDCKTSDDKQCSVDSLLFPGTQAAWKDVTSALKAASTQKRYQLTIPKEGFPVLDQQFFVGCTKNGVQNISCQVNITVNARASEVSADNVVTCAYGKESNKTPVAVTLTPEKNSFTLKCGSEGTQTPAEKDSYCSGTSVDACDLKKLTSIIPKAEASWWADVVANQSMKFTIPTDKFPSADTVFLVGCKKPEKEKDATSCNVKVTVKSSAASGFQGAFSFGVVSAVVLAVSSALFA